MTFHVFEFYSVRSVLHAGGYVHQPEDALRRSLCVLVLIHSVGDRSEGLDEPSYHEYEHDKLPDCERSRHVRWRSGYHPVATDEERRREGGSGEKLHAGTIEVADTEYRHIRPVVIERGLLQTVGLVIFCRARFDETHAAEAVFKSRVELSDRRTHPPVPRFD